MVAAIIGSYFAAYPQELTKLVDMVPEKYRPIVSLVVAITIFSTATTARLVKQGKPLEKVPENWRDHQPVIEGKYHPMEQTA